MTQTKGRVGVDGWWGEVSRIRATAWAGPIGVLAGEAVAVVVLSQRVVQMAVELVLAAALALASRSSPGALTRQTLAVAALTAVFAVAYRLALA